MQKHAIAVIPARGGSKRIPRKNIRDFLGKPIIAYPIRAAIESKIFDDVIVSTDDEEIASVARQYGASVPFMRSAETSDDFATIADVLKEVLRELEKTGTTYTWLCGIYPTAPFVNPDKLNEAMRLLKNSNEKADALLPVVRYSHPIQRAVEVDPDGRMRMVEPANVSARTQDLSPRFHDSGQFFFLRVEAFQRKPTIWQENMLALELPESEVQDVDSLEDWKLAEFKYDYLSRRS